MGEQVILEFQHITKKYSGTVALDDVSVAFRDGEIHALCGENGAGKSTLIKTCSGAISPTGGKILINGREFDRLTPVSSREHGVAVIYQEFNLVNELSVAENIFVGAPICRGVVPDFRAMEKKTQELFDTFHLNVNPKTLVRDLSIGMQQMVEIAKAVSQNTKILIMDEPTAPLTNSEVEILMNMIQKLKKSGVTIVYISHRLEEIFRISDRVSVLRDGKLICTMQTKDTNKDELIKYMVGRELKESYPRRSPHELGDIILETRNLTGNGVKDISFSVRRGEVVGIGGIMGAGRTELAQLLFGYKKAESGDIIYKGQKVHFKCPADATKTGIALVPEDRKQQGAILDLSIKHNMTLSMLRRICRFSFIDMQQEQVIAQKYKQEIGVKTVDIDNPVSSLSGGNQQKVILSKWLAMKPELIILDEPTRGIDVGAKHEIYTLINQLVEAGMTIIMITSEMEELIGMSDRILVLSEGMLTADLEKNKFDKETILFYASKREGIA